MTVRELKPSDRLPMSQGRTFVVTEVMASDGCLVLLADP
jgi:hypothetical protein